MRWILLAIVLPIFFSFAVSTADAKGADPTPTPTPTPTSGWTVISLNDGALD